jgi:uncharacterized C2H2 Zn-finger protein
MAVIPDAKRRERIPLVEGRQMRCPRCKAQNDILRYVPMGMIEEYVDETNPIYKCPECRWIFSPALTPAELIASFGHIAQLAQQRQADD